MTQALASEGITLAGIFACPHLESADCFCRKPKAGLIRRALNETNFLIDMDRSVLIGDSEADMLAGQAAGVTTRVMIGPAASGSAATHTAPRIGDILEHVAAPSALVSSSTGKRVEN